MIPTFLFLMVRRYQKTHPQQFNALCMKARFFGRILLCLLVALLLVTISLAQPKRLSYTVKRAGKDIGTLIFKETVNGNRTSHLMFSDIKVRFLFNFHAKGKEEAVYENGVLTFSCTLQKMNGDIETDNKTTRLSNGYIVYAGSDTSKLATYPIHYSMASLYGIEPVDHKEVYSDKYKKLLPIQRVGAHHYRIVFPNGNQNEYFYNNGICTRIKIDAGMFKAEMILN